MLMAASRRRLPLPLLLLCAALIGVAVAEDECKDEHDGCKGWATSGECVICRSKKKAFSTNKIRCIS